MEEKGSEVLGEGEDEGFAGAKVFYFGGCGDVFGGEDEGPPVGYFFFYFGVAEFYDGEVCFFFDVLVEFLETDFTGFVVYDGND